VAVHRDIPNRVRISIEERIPVAAIVLDKLYYLDSEGYVLPPARSQFIFDLPVLTGALPENEFAAGKQTKNKNVRDALYVLSVAKDVDEEMYRNISELRLDGMKDFVFYTAEFGIPVVLGREQVGPRLVKFDSFWKSVVVRNGASELQYIDLRFEDQVVVRWNHNEGDVHS
jgi:cell division septal protein FtsQ